MRVSSIVEIWFGSHLYGTSTPSSDLDLKAVFLPSAEEILLQRVRGTVQRKRDKAHGEKNQPGDVDEEAFALHRFLELVTEGQTVAMDMLFAPRWAMLCEPHAIWQEVVANRHRLLSRKAGSFVGYCRTQANKYGIKGSRVHAVRAIVEWFDQAVETFGAGARLGKAAGGLAAFIAERELQHTAIVPVLHRVRGVEEPHLECCNRKAPFTASLKDSRAIYARVLAEYGSRALLAEKSEGIDWKALSHAIRVGHEALELLATGRITFPLPYAERILAVKLGQVPYQAVAEEIEELLERVEAAQGTSPLPEAPDQRFVEDVVCRAYGGVVVEG